MRLLLIGWGATAAVAAGVELARAEALSSVGPQWTFAFLTTYVVGIWALRADPANRAALRLLVFGCMALTFLAVSSELIVQVRSGSGGMRFVAGNAVVQTVGLLMVCSQVSALVRYPDGVPLLTVERLLVGVVAAVALTLPTLLLLTTPEVVPAWVLEWSSRSDGLVVPAADSPWYISGLARLGPAMQAVHASVLAVAPLLAIGVVAARFRLLGSEQRQRVAWPLLAALVFLLGMFVSQLAEAGTLPRLVGEGAYIAVHVLLPISLGIGIAAPGIYDALGTVQRTVTFVVLSALILGMYVGAAGYLGITFGGQDLRVAVAIALLAALVLEPIRRTLVRRAERVAYGQEITRDELLQRLGDTLEHTMDRHALTESIAKTALEGLGAQWVLLEPDGAPRVHVGRAVRSDEKPALTARLLHGHDDLGAISCGPSDSGPALSRSRVQFETLARQVAMALTNARLADQLNHQLAEVDASRQRLVTAEETARRRLERDLHDGAQQDLAALLTRIALARSQLSRADLDRLDETLATLQSGAGEALKNLRELASGIHETTLADAGLVAAIEGRAARLPLPVKVVFGPGVRGTKLAPTVESTAYFTVCETLANTLKHADADRATITLVLQGSHLHIDVTDDGHGFDSTRLNGSNGLTGLRDRLSAVGGTLTVRSTPGRGTTVSAVVPTNP
jgi:signal transduction histidine kinase